MSTVTKKQAGDFGEEEICALILCPNCGKPLMKLPKNYPLVDVQCTGCNFRAQVKTSSSKSKKEILGATWDVLDKVLKSGYLVPALIVNFKWKEMNNEKQEIRFYPFVPKKNLKKRFTTISKSGRQLWMFNYIALDILPYFVLYNK